MADSLARLRTLAWLMGMGAALAATGCVSTGASAYLDEPITAKAEAVHARVQFLHPHGCVDPRAQVLSPSRVYELANTWVPEREDPGYTQPGVKYQAPQARYPKSELSGEPAAVLVLIMIEASGNVASVLPVCSTSKAFDPYAIRTVRDNQYAPGTLKGTPARSVAFQTVIFMPNH